MCYAVYIGTNQTLDSEAPITEQTDIHFKALRDKEEIYIRPKFSKPNIYYVGAQSGCSCGLAFDSNDLGNPENLLRKQSLERFIELLKEMTLTENIEYYCCWEDDWDLPVETFREIDTRKISIDDNYSGLIEKEFITFRKQTTA